MIWIAPPEEDAENAAVSFTLSTLHGERAWMRRDGHPRPSDGRGAGGEDGRFDFVLANPPFNVNAVDTAMRVSVRRKPKVSPQDLPEWQDHERFEDMFGTNRRFPFGLPRTDSRHPTHIALFRNRGSSRKAQLFLSARFCLRLLLLGSPAAEPSRLQFGTTIVLYADSNSITVGADWLGHNVDQQRVGYIRKVHEKDGVVFANSGLQSNPQTGLSIAELALQHLERKRSLAENVAVFEQAVSNTIIAMVLGFSPQTLKQAAFTNAFLAVPVIETVHAAFRDGQPQLYRRRFVLEYGTNKTPSIRISREDALADTGDTYTCLGSVARIEKLLQREPEFFSKRRPVDAVRELVELEVPRKAIDGIPPPLVVQLTAKGLSWVPWNR